MGYVLGFVRNNWAKLIIGIVSVARVGFLINECKMIIELIIELSNVTHTLYQSLAGLVLSVLLIVILNICLWLPARYSPFNTKTRKELDQLQAEAQERKKAKLQKKLSKLDDNNKQ